MADNNSMKLQEGVQVSHVEAKPSSESQVKRTTAAATALLALALYAGSPAPAKAETPADRKAVATFVVNAEYEGIIAEAKKQGKDPIDLGVDMKKDGKLTFTQYRAFSKYCVDKSKQEGEKLDQEISIGKQELINKGRSLIAVFEGLLREGRFTAKEETIINRMYTSDATPIVIKQELLAKFEKYIGRGMIIAQNTAN